MKLKYQMREGSYRLVAVDPVYHDAAMAHALVIALQEQMMIGHRLSVAPIELRATNLLREWGYAE